MMKTDIEVRQKCIICYKCDISAQTGYCLSNSAGVRSNLEVCIMWVVTWFLDFPRIFVEVIMVLSLLLLFRVLFSWCSFLCLS